MTDEKRINPPYKSMFDIIKDMGLSVEEFDKFMKVLTKTGASAADAGRMLGMSFNKYQQTVTMPRKKKKRIRKLLERELKQ